jgi:hypothetical protein
MPARRTLNDYEIAEFEIAYASRIEGKHRALSFSFCSNEENTDESDSSTASRWPELLIFPPSPGYFWPGRSHRM